MKKAKYKRVPSGIKTYEHSVAKKLSKLICTPFWLFFGTDVTLNEWKNIP